MIHPSHEEYADRITPVNLDPKEFSGEDVNFIESWACWMSALAKGQIAPTTEGQIQFVAVTQGGRRAATDKEKLWMRYSALANCKRCHRKVPSSDYSNSICPSCISNDQRETGIPNLQLKTRAEKRRNGPDPLGLAILREAEDQARER